MGWLSTQVAWVYETKKLYWLYIMAGEYQKQENTRKRGLVQKYSMQKEAETRAFSGIWTRNPTHQPTYLLSQQFEDTYPSRSRKIGL